MIKISGTGDDGKKYIVTIEEEGTSVVGTTTVLTVAPVSPTVEGTPLSLSAAVSPATASGLVAFEDGTKPVAVVPVVSGKAAVSGVQATPGLHSFRANFTPLDPSSHGASRAVEVTHSVTVKSTIEPNTVKIGTATYRVAGTNVKREKDACVRIVSPATTSAENMWGTEVSVVNGKVVAVNDRQASISGDGTPVPAGGYLLSGNGAAKDWLDLHAKKGATVELLKQDAPIPVPALDTSLSVYYMIWSNSPRVRAISLPSRATDLRVSFGNGNPLGLVGDSPYGLATLDLDCATVRAAGKRVVLSIGGGGYTTNTSDTAGFVSRFQAISTARGGYKGIDWDIEKNFNGDECLRISAALRKIYGPYPGFKISWAPNGTTVGAYLKAAKAGVADGLFDEFGQQFYDAPVSLEKVGDRMDEALSFGLTPSQLSIGMMIGPGSNYWTLPTCIANAKAIRASHGVRKSYYWELSREGVVGWADGVGAAFA